MGGLFRPRQLFAFMQFLKYPIMVFLAFGISYLLTPLTVPVCRAIGAEDIPDGVRKIHTLPTPRIGGLAFFLAFAIILAPFIAKSPYVAATLSGGAILVAGGVCDDAFGLSPPIKLVIQTSAALVAIFIIGLPPSLSFFGLFNIRLVGAIGFLFVLGRLVFTVNAVNFSDGLDGLASGLSVTALLALSIYGAVNLNTPPAVAAAVLAFSVLGFLPYNKYQAKIFMGDSGSQFLGFAIAILSLGCSREGSFALECSLFLAIPTLDTALSVTRRLIKKQSPFVADKGHLHHVLLKSGVSHPTAVKILVASSAVAALATLLFYI